MILLDVFAKHRVQRRWVLVEAALVCCIVSLAIALVAGGLFDVFDARLTGANMIWIFICMQYYGHVYRARKS